MTATLYSGRNYLSSSFAVVCSPEFQRETKISAPADLARVAVLSLDKAGTWWDRLILSLRPEERLELRRIVAVNHIRAMITAAANGLGAALVPRYSVLGEIRADFLVQLFPQVEIAQDRFYVYQKERRSGLRRHRLLVDYLKSIRPSEFGA